MVTTTEATVQDPAETIDTVTTWWDNPLTQQWLVERPIHIAIIIVVALLLHWLARRVITKLADASISNGGLQRKRLPRMPLMRGGASKRVRREQDSQIDALEKARENRRISRIRTLANVARSAAAIFVWAWAALAILSSLDVNIAPLIASAGVVGVALGFGAQSLVKDFISGIFMLLEDQYGIGDTIDLGNGVFGDVEEITLRITTVRDIDGALWYVRNGEIMQVANHSDEYSVARLQIPVGLNNNHRQASTIIEAALADAVREPELAGLVVEAPELKGISEIQPDYASYRATVKTLPGKQWDVQRALQAKVLEAMEDNGISTPYPHGIGITAPRPTGDDD